MKNINFIPVLIYILISISCKNEVIKVDIKHRFENNIKYANGFDIITKNGIKKLIIKSPYQNSKDVFEYQIKNKTVSKNINKNNLIIEVPITKIVVTSTTHIPMVELLNEEATVIGFPYSKYVSSEKTRQLIDSGNITEIGKENSLNTEILLDLEPEIVVGYSVSSADKSLTTIKKAGINVIYNGDWLEETPLGRAEWIKFFGVLFNKEKQDDSIFKIIETNYLEAKKLH